MFYVDNGLVKLRRDGTVVCDYTELDRVVHELSNLRSVANHREEELSAEDRFTPEGIDRYFEVSPDFVVHEELWEQDSQRNWEHLTGPELFSRYQREAQAYCWSCMDIGIEPTYQGFREWLVRFRDNRDCPL